MKTYDSPVENGVYSVEEDVSPDGNTAVWSVSFWKKGYEDSPEYLNSFDSRDLAERYIEAEIARAKPCL